MKKSFLMRTVLGVALAFLLLPVSEEALAQYQMKIEFPGYTNRTDTLTNFPALVVLSNNVEGSGFDYDTFLSDDGYDLRFRDADDTTDLNYEIELWDTNSASYVWVQVPEMPADGSGYIWAKWGLDDTQQACTTNGAVWSQGYAAIWHLQETSGTHTDWTREGNDGTIGGGVVQAATGIVDGADTFDGSGDYIDVGRLENIEGSAELTVSGWIRLDGISSSDTTYDGSILAKAPGTSSGCLLFWYNALGDDANNTFTFKVGSNTGNNRVDAGADGVASQWQYVCGVMNGAYRGIYVDGTLRRSHSDATAMALGSDTDDARIGGWSFTSNFDHDGGLDEIRVSTSERSTDWIWAEYMTVASNTVFADYGAAQASDLNLPSISTLPASGLATNQATLNGRLLSTGATETAVSVYWEAGGDQGTNTTDWMNEESFGAYSPAMGALPYDYATNITGLSAGTTYSYRYYATNDAGEAWGGAQSFTTWDAPSATIASPSRTGILSVVASCEITGGVPDPQAWFVLNEGNDGDSNSTGAWDIVESAGTQSGVFSNQVTGLKADTLYYARVYVTNEVDEAWSDAVSFSTLPSPTQLTLDGDQPIDGADPELTFEEVPDDPLKGEGTDPDWLYDFSYYSTSSVPVLMGTNKFYSVSENGTVTFEFNGGPVTGDLDAVAFDTHKTGDGWDDLDASSIGIFDVGDMAIGKVLTYSTAGGGSASYQGHGGYIAIGSESSRAGSLRIAGLRSSATGKGRGGDITIYASGYVHVVDGNGIPATIDTRGKSVSAGAGNITIDHVDSLVSGNIHAYSSGGNYADGGNVSFTGSGTGSCAVSNILTHSWQNPENVNWVGVAGNILIRGYTDVTIADINTENDGVKSAGNLVITNISNSITISGEIDLNAYQGGNYEGYALLEAGGSISVADLDLDRVRYISFNSQSKENYITGTLTNFTGTVESADDTRLRAPLDHRIYYEPELNPGLNGDAYPLKGLDGSSEGGTLMVEPASGTVIIVH